MPSSCEHGAQARREVPGAAVNAPGSKHLELGEVAKVGPPVKTKNKSCTTKMLTPAAPFSGLMKLSGAHGGSSGSLPVTFKQNSGVRVWGLFHVWKPKAHLQCPRNSEYLLSRGGLLSQHRSTKLDTQQKARPMSLRRRLQEVKACGEAHNSKPRSKWMGTINASTLRSNKCHWA